jgi:hypothetical protein
MTPARADSEVLTAVKFGAAGVASAPAFEG